jgi:hypothetical protein
VEEERVKSALELAMERISALPELTPQEIAEQKERQYGPVGEALAGKYLSGLVDDEELTIQIKKQPADLQPIVLRALVSSLCRVLQLEGDLESAGKALSGMRRAVPEKLAIIEKAAGEYLSMVHAYEQEQKDKSASIETAALRPLGISGTAVRCNPGENPHWLEELKKLRNAYDPRLENLRSNLLQELLKS